MKFLNIAGAAFLALWAFLGPHGEVQAAEWIESFKGKASDYSIKRDGKDLRLRPLLRLKAGDRIVVKTAGGQLGILKPDKSIHTVSAANSPYVVPASRQVSVWDNLLGIASNWVADGSEDSSRVETITRSASGTRFIQVTSAPAEQNLLIEGQDELLLAWSGGQAPFDVTIYEKDGKTPVWTGEQLDASSTRLVVKGMKPAPYRIRVSGQAGNRKIATVVDVKVVAKNALPNKAQELLTSSLPENIKNRLLVTELAKKPQWRFQAYDLARRLNIPEARKALENGQYPKRSAKGTTSR